MATHDYIIANGTGAAVRADLNNALAAIVSNNSNSSEPATKYAYQWWADLSNSVMKIRKSANDGWIELFQLDGTITLEDGSASTPALANRSDLNTGVFFSAADKFNIATGGVERMELGTTTIFNEDGADVDFRIEGDTEANLFYVDAGNDRVGIGLANPSSLFHVQNASVSDTKIIIESTGTNSSPALRLKNDAITYELSIDGSTDGIRLLDVTNSVEHLRVDDSGRILLGTSANAPIGGFNARLQLSGTNENKSTFSMINNANDSNGPRILLAKQKSGAAGGTALVADGDEIGAIRFVACDGQDLAHRVAEIQCVMDGTPSANDLPAEMRFFTTQDGSTTILERMSIDNKGAVLIGKRADSTGANARAKLSIDCDDLDAGANLGDADKYGLVFLNDSTTGTSNGIGFFNDDGSKCGGAILHEDKGSANIGDLVFYTSASADTPVERLRIDKDGNVGIALNNASEKLHVSGNILATGTITPNSDIAFKKDIKPLTNVLNKVTQLIGINFRYKNNNEESMGLVAQDVEKVFPELVKGEEGNKSLNYMGLTGALIEAIKELSAKVETLEAA